MSIDLDEVGEADHRRLGEILTFAVNMEQVGYVVDRNLRPHPSKRLKRDLAFSKENEAALSAMMERLISNLRTAASLFMTEDPRAASAPGSGKGAISGCRIRRDAFAFRADASAPQNSLIG